MHVQAGIGGNATVPYLLIVVLHSALNSALLIRDGTLSGCNSTEHNMYRYYNVISVNH